MIYKVRTIEDLPIDEQFLTWLTFLWKYDLFTGSILPSNILSAEPAITITIRMIRAVIIFPDIVEVDFAASPQFCMEVLPIWLFLDLFGAKGFRINKLIYFILCHARGICVCKAVFTAP